MQETCDKCGVVTTRRLVDVIADEAVLDIAMDASTVHHVSVRRPDRKSDAHPLGETVWVVLVGDPEDEPDPDETMSVADQLRRAGGTVYSATLRHPAWTLPAIAVTGVPAARIRHLAKWSTRMCWTPSEMAIEGPEVDDGVRSGNFEVTTERRRISDDWADELPVEDIVRERLAAIASRRAGIGPGGFFAYRHAPGSPLELVARIDLNGSLPGAAYWRNGVPWRSAPENVDFQAHSIEDIRWLVDAIVAAPVALPNEDQRTFARIRERLATAGEPAWVTPSTTAFYLEHDGLLRGPKVDLHPGYTGAELRQAAFLESAPADVIWLLERLRSRLLPGVGERGVCLERPHVPDGSVDLEFPTDRSIGDLEVGRSSALPGSVRMAQGHVVIAADQRVRFTGGPDFAGEDLAYFVGHAHGMVSGLVLGGAPIGAADLALIARIPGLRALDLEGCEITGEDLSVLAPLTDLRYLVLDGTDISDAGLRHLAPLHRLEVLSLGQTRVSGKGLEHLVALERLEQLNLFGCAGVKNEGLRHLLALTRLRTLNLDATGVTEKGLEPLWSLPDLERIVAYPGAL